MEKIFQKKNVPVHPKHSGELGDGVLTHGSSVSPFPSGIQVQAQLETTAPGDALEREADSTADLVLRKIETGSSGAVQGPSLSVRPSISASGGSSVSIPSHMESRLHSSRGGGHALPGQLRSQMEGAFGQGFSNVRIHSDSSAAELSRSIGAKAFTYGNDIYFNAGQYRPETSEGMHLLAHELTHTVQQSGKVAREAEQQDTDGDGTSFGDVLNCLLKANNYFIKFQSNLPALAKQISQLEAVAPFIDKVIQHFPKLNDFWRRTSELAGGLKKGLPLRFMALAAWAYSLYSLAKRMVDAAGVSVAGCGYYACRAILVFITPPKPLPSVPGAPGLVIKVFNLSSFFGDLMNNAAEAIGYSDLKQKQMHFVADRYGGADTALGLTMAGLTSIPIVGEGVAGGHWLWDRTVDAGNAIENMLYDGYKSFMNGLMPF